MRRSGRISVNLSTQQLLQLRRTVDAGEFDSIPAAVREAVRVWLHRRTLHAGAHGAQRLARTIEARHGVPLVEPSERVELLFDAADAKA